MSRSSLSDFLDPPLKGTSKTLCREEPNMSTAFTKNISMMALCLKKSWETCKGIGSPKASAAVLKKQRKLHHLPISIYASSKCRLCRHFDLIYALCLYRKVVKFSKSCFHLLFLNSREIHAYTFL